MLRIGEAANQFDISNRTLRYWEEQGILTSDRSDAGYRFYDEENATRIKQIVLLRKLRMPIAEIERMFLSGDCEIAKNIMIRHLQNMKKEALVLGSTNLMLEKIIRSMKSELNLTLMLSHLETQAISAVSVQESALQIVLSERNVSMAANQLNDVRIVRIPGMTVASYRAESATPEQDCSEVVNKFVLDNALHKKSGFRHFGFNNPNPTENNPVYGYEIWVAIPDDFDVPAPLVKKRFEGGLYASIATKMGEIGERWQQLYHWTKNSEKYDVDFSFQWLEECIDYETFITGEESAQQLDLLEPIKQR